MPKPLVIAFSKGRLLQPTISFFKQLGISSSDLSPESRSLTFNVPEKNIEILLVRAVDVATYVEYGAADIGVAGKDLLLEQMCDVYEPVDLGFGHCQIVLAGPHRNANGEKRYSKLRIASKYPNITERYFLEKGIPIEIIKLYGSIELAPSVGLADQIVDLSSSGETLRANHLAIIEQIAECTARIIVNRASQKLRYPDLQKLIHEIKARLSKRLSKDKPTEIM